MSASQASVKLNRLLINCRKKLKFLNIVYLQFQIVMTYCCCIISLVYYCDWTPMSHYDSVTVSWV